MTMVEAAEAALRQLDRPASVRDIYAEIQRQNSFSFGAKDPVSVLGGAIRRRTNGSKTLKGTPLFRKNPDGTYALA